MRTNYVLIDFENVQPATLEPLKEEHFRLVVFVGASQSRLPFEVADSLQRLGTRAEYVKISGNGTNSLDFHIAYYIGKLAAEEPTAAFSIVSRDTGFDPLIQHLKSKGLRVRRVKTIAEIPVSKDHQATPPTERIDVVLAYLKRMKTSRPSTVKTLNGTIRALFRKQLSDAEVLQLIETLKELGILSINNTKIVYRFAGDGEIIASAETDLKSIQILDGQME